MKNLKETVGSLKSQLAQQKREINELDRIVNGCNAAQAKNIEDIARLNNEVRDFDSTVNCYDASSAKITDEIERLRIQTTGQEKKNLASDEGGQTIQSGGRQA